MPLPIQALGEEGGGLVFAQEGPDPAPCCSQLGTRPLLSKGRRSELLVWLLASCWSSPGSAAKSGPRDLFPHSSGPLARLVHPCEWGHAQAQNRGAL